MVLTFLEGRANDAVYNELEGGVTEELRMTPSFWLQQSSCDLR